MIPCGGDVSGLRPARRAAARRNALAALRPPPPAALRAAPRRQGNGKGRGRADRPRAADQPAAGDPVAGHRPCRRSPGRRSRGPTSRGRTIDLPAAPEWLRAILEAKRYWLPILIGIVLTVRELRAPAPGRALRDLSVRRAYHRELLLRPLRRAPMMLGGVGSRSAWTRCAASSSPPRRRRQRPAPTSSSELKELKALLDEGVLSPEEFGAAKRTVLGD